MKRKTIAGIAVVAVLVVIVAVQPLRSAALGALSVFRVNQVDVIKISVTDIEEMAQNLSSLQNIQKPDKSPVTAVSQQEPATETLTDISAFTDFDVKLPSALAAQTPKIEAVGPGSAVFTVDPAVVNALLASLGSSYSLPGSLADVQYTLTTPAAVMVLYDSACLVATQVPVLTASSDRAVQALQNAALSVPLIPADLSAQLAAINLSDNNVYLPVIDGLGRAASFNGTTGYIYTMSDVQSLMGTLSQSASLQSLLGGLSKDSGKTLMPPSGDAPAMTDKMDAMDAMGGDMSGMMGGATDSGDMSGMMDKMQNASVLIWTQNGVLYALAGAMSDQELVSIAKSMG